MTKARTLADNFAADINGITAGVGITGGGTSGTVTITNDMATTIAAKGDLIAGTGNDTYAALTLGTNNHVLTADSSTATGLKWAAPAAGGKVLQVVSTNTTTQVQITSTTLTDSGITATITPSSTNSKILVIISASVFVSRGSAANDQYTGARLLRGATQLLDWGAANFVGVGVSSVSATLYLKNVASVSYLDSPSTTSPTTYKLQGRVESGGNIYFQFSSSPSVITLLEIGA